MYHACVLYVRRDLTHASINFFLVAILTLLSVSTCLISFKNFPTIFLIFIAEHFSKVCEFRDFSINRKQLPSYLSFNEKYLGFETVMYICAQSVVAGNFYIFLET